MKTECTEHERWMRRALNLARRGVGLTRPNPAVGAVVVARGRVVGEGYHRCAGGPHAEVYALRQAGRRAAGATLYITLEPCCTWGRTPPCTAAILTSGVAQLVVAVRDPNPSHHGRGLRLLRRHGLGVREGICAAEAAELIRPFRTWVLKGRPQVTLKLALTVDGRIADARGRARWITGAKARQVVHALRRQADAILIGRGTAAADNPGLLPVPAGGRRPFRVLVDSRGELPAGLRVLTDAAAPRTIVAVTARCPPARRRALAAGGAQVWVMPARQGGVSLKALLARLGRMGLLHVVCEGGGELAAGLIEAGLVDDFRLFLAPRVLGGPAKPAVGGRGWPLASCPELDFLSVERLGPDILICARPRAGP